MEQARRRKESALLDFGVGQSTVASWLYAKCHHHIPTTLIPTAAVVAFGDGSRALLYNPRFFMDLDFDGVKFVLFHEARHLMHRHLHVDEDLRSDPAFTLAAEVAINHVALERLRWSGLPTVPSDEGEDEHEDGRKPVGVDPAEVYEAYQEDLRQQGLSPLPYGDFIHTDLTVYGELRRMRAFDESAPGFCIHLDGHAGDAVPLDPETVERLGGEVLHQVMQAALRGDPAARAELLDLADRTAAAGSGCPASGATSAWTGCAAPPRRPAASTGGSGGWSTCSPPS